MKVSLKWLKRYVAVEASVEELCQVFPMLGLEVDAVDYVGLPPLEKVVVGEVLSREQHPDADRLSVCEVEVGKESPLQIVCGATNYKVGDRVFVALVGSCLPDNFKIKKSKLRGVVSKGMMCSSKELGLGDDQEGLLILEDRPEIGTPINAVLKDGDIVFELELTANRGDCLSHIGVARELAAWYDLALQYPEVPDLELVCDGPGNALLKEIDVQSKACSLYTAWAIKGISLGPSPDWLKKDLEAVGLRPINNVVDVTNWVMMETGQPLHAFDSGKIRKQSLVIRQAKAGEKITTLDEKERGLDASMMVIADKERALVVAGVMGSLDAEVDNKTVDIILEAAYFDPASIRKTSRQLNLSTDSSYRFARDVDPQKTPYAAKRAVQMILEVAGGAHVAPAMGVGSAPRGTRSIHVTGDFIRKGCGFDVEDSAIENAFRRLGFEVKGEGGAWEVTIPTFRSEVERPVDLLEEFIRIYGMDKIPPAPVVFEGLSRKNDFIAVFNHKVGDYLIGQHFDECCHYSLHDGEEIKDLFGEAQALGCALSNPLSADYTHVRPSLLPGLWDALKVNQDHGNHVERLFETGRVFRVAEGKSWELVSAAFVMVQEPSKRHWLKRKTPDFYKAKSIILEIAQLAGIDLLKLDFEPIKDSHLWQEGQSAQVGDFVKEGFMIAVGIVNLSTANKWGLEGSFLAGEISILPKFFDKKKSLKVFKPYSSYPASVKDLALVMDNAVPGDSVRKELEGIAREVVAEAFNVEGVRLFDVYEGKGLEEGKKSIAFSITFRAEDRTLKDKEVIDAFNEIQEKITTDERFKVRA